MAKATQVRVPAQSLSPKKKGKRWLKGLFLALLFFMSVAVIGVSVFWTQTLNQAAKLMPRLPAIMREVASRPTVVLDKDGKPLFRMQSEFREPVRVEKVPPLVLKCIVAAEDRRFFEHKGVDWWGMVRAGVTTASGRRVEGGSTITMQLAKLVFTSSEKTFERKIQDMALAEQMERRLTKNQILELYINHAYFGSGAWGLSAAADVYYGKELGQLTLGEAATLARCVRRPSEENPIKSPEIAKRNRDVVLAIMREHGEISEDQYRKSLAEPIRTTGKRPTGIFGAKVAPYFVDYVLAQLDRQLPGHDFKKGGYKIETTLDSKLQEYADDVVASTVRRYRPYRVTTAAFVILDNDGRILAMVGGPDYERSQYNNVTQGKRQPGSSFKPIIYAAAFEQGYLSPYGSIRNDPYYIKDDRGRRRPVKGGGKGGNISVRTAIAKSVNTPAVWAIDMVGPENAVRMAKASFGFTTDLPPVVSLSLGSGVVSPLEMAAAYSVFQSGGSRIVPFGIKHVTAPDGQTLLHLEPTVVPLCVSNDTAEGVDSCLRSVVTGGTGHAAGSVTNARGKTGTTSDNKDAWFCGYTDRLIAVGWIANEQRHEGRRSTYEEMSSAVMGGDFVAPMWARIMREAQQRYKEKARSFRGGSVGSANNRDEDTEPGPLEESAEPAPENNEGEPEPAMPETVPPIDDSPVVTNPDPAPVEGDRGDQGGSVMVEVCADSGQRATIYCPERSRRAFKKGSEPRGRCPIHRGPH